MRTVEMREIDSKKVYSSLGKQIYDEVKDVQK